MQDVLAVPLPGEIRQMLNRTPEEMGRDLRLYAALMLFRLGKLSSGAGAAMAGVPRVMFLDLCAEYGISISQITADELRREMGTESCRHDRRSVTSQERRVDPDRSATIGQSSGGGLSPGA